MKKIIFILLSIFLIIPLSSTSNLTDVVFASPESALLQNQLAERILIKLQNNVDIDEELENMYKYFDVLCHENTQFYSYKIEKLEGLMDNYRNSIISKARQLAQNNEYKQAVDFLESKSEIFKDKTTINSLITYYSKFFIADGLFYCSEEPKILAINKLIAYPNLAFKDNPNSENLDKYYLTSKEFQNLLNELYINNYILIDVDNIIEINENITTKKDLYLPKDKKPIILLFNNINYYENENHFVDKIIIDGKNDVATFSSKQTEKNQVSYTADFLPILENFIKENKDFSFKNAKGIISFDKSGSIFGYNINKSNPNLSQETANLKKLVSHLKELNYKFAYGIFNENYYNFTNDELLDELINLKENILPNFNNLSIFISPFSPNKSNNFYTELNNLGFKIFIDNSNYSYCLIKNHFVFTSFIKIDGNFLRDSNNFLNIEKEKIYDHNNRNKLF